MKWATDNGLEVNAAKTKLVSYCKTSKKIESMLLAKQESKNWAKYEAWEYCSNQN